MRAIETEGPNFQRGGAGYRAVLLDIDGTIRDSKKLTPPETTAVMRELDAAGVFLGYATGRPWFAARTLLPEAPVNAPCILSAGASVYDPLSGEALLCSDIPRDSLLRLAEGCRELRLALELSTPDGFFVEQDLADNGDEVAVILARHAVYLRPHLPVCERFEQVIERETILKAEIMVPRTQVAVALELLREFPELQLAQTHASSDPDLEFLNLVGPAVSRPAALFAVIEGIKRRYGVELKPGQFVAFGDGESDIETFRAVGLAVAMGNANETVKAAADYVAPHVDEGGLATALRTIFGS